MEFIIEIYYLRMRGIFGSLKVISIQGKEKGILWNIVYVF